MTHRVVDLGDHRQNFGGIDLDRRLPEVGMAGLANRILIGEHRVLQALELGDALSGGGRAQAQRRFTMGIKDVADAGLRRIAGAGQIVDGKVHDLS